MRPSFLSDPIRYSSIPQKDINLQFSCLQLLKYLHSSLETYGNYRERGRYTEIDTINYFTDNCK